MATGGFLLNLFDTLSLRQTLFCGFICLLCARFSCAENITNSPAFPLSPYTLGRTLDIALKQNPDILIARKKLEEAAGGIIEARAGFLPSLTTWDNYQKFQSDYATLKGANPATRNEIWNVSVRLVETAYAGGAVRGKWNIAKLNQKSRLLDYQSAVNQVMMDVRIAFYEILKNQAGIAVHQQAVDFLRKQAQFEKQRLDIGTGQRLNSLRAEVDLSLEQAALLESQNLWRNSYLRVSELLAIPYSLDQTNIPFAIAGELIAPRFDLTEPECLAIAFDHRPELKVRLNELQVQKQQFVVDRSTLLPQVNLFVGYDVVSEPDRSLPDDYYKGYVAGVGVVWNIFDGFAARGRMRATRARIEEAEISQAATGNRIRAEVVKSFRDLQRARETMQSQQENVKLATESQSLAAANFKEGLITQLDLLQSQLGLTRAQSVELNARFDYNSALAQLQRAIGTEFNFSEGREGK